MAAVTKLRPLDRYRCHSKLPVPNLTQAVEEHRTGQRVVRFILVGNTGEDILSRKGGKP
jgi:hypothetical protein